jgi:predicted transcriptional regulator
MKIQTLRELRDEMKAVTRGERVAPAQANAPVYESADALLRLLTPDNRKLLAMIAQKQPKSVAALALLSGRAESNLSRTLAKLQSAGIVRMDDGDGRAKVPSVAIHLFRLEIDVFTAQDHVETVAA